MIISLFLNILGNVFLTLINLLPVNTGLPDWVVNGITVLITPLSSVSWFLPVQALLNVMVLMIGVRIFFFFFGVVRWTISSVRGSAFVYNNVL